MVTVALTYGPRTDWLRNVRAAGGARMRLRGEVLTLGPPHAVPTAVGMARVPAPPGSSSPASGSTSSSSCRSCRRARALSSRDGDDAEAEHHGRATRVSTGGMAPRRTADRVATPPGGDDAESMVSEDQPLPPVARPGSAVPLGDHGFLSDGEVSAWSRPVARSTGCACPASTPRASSAAILGRRAGRFRIAPLDVSVPGDRRYLPGTMVLETSWGTATGWMIVRDALLVGPWHHEDDRSRTYARTPRLPGRARAAADPALRLAARSRPSWTVSRCSTTGASRLLALPRRRLPPRRGEQRRRRARG